MDDNSSLVGKLMIFKDNLIYFDDRDPFVKNNNIIQREIIFILYIYLIYKIYKYILI